MARMTPFQKAFDAARADKKKTFEFPPGSGRRFSTQTAEEQGREIGAKAAAGSGRGASAGRTAADRDTAADRRDTIPGAGPYSAPASAGEGMSETRRNIANIVSALPAARAVSMAGKAAQTASAARTASKAAPMARREPELGLPAQGRVFRSARPDAEAAKQAEYMRRVEELGLKKGGTAKAYAKGGSVRGGGCETRSKKTRYV